MDYIYNKMLAIYIIKYFTVGLTLGASGLGS